MMIEMAITFVVIAVFSVPLVLLDLCKDAPGFRKTFRNRRKESER